MGDFILHEMQERGIDISYVSREPGLSTGACVALSTSSDRALVTYLGSLDALKMDVLPLEQMSRYDHLHLSSIFLLKGLQPDFSRLFKTAKNLGLTTSLDCGWDPANRWEVDFKPILPFVDVFLPNEVEAMQVSQTSSAEKAAEMLSQFGNTIVIKRGESGALAQKGSEVWESSAYQVEVIETTGAGDCFNAGLLYTLFHEHKSLPDSLCFANGCGAIGASTPGGSSAILSAAEVHQFVRRVYLNHNN